MLKFCRAVGPCCANGEEDANKACVSHVRWDALGAMGLLSNVLTGVRFFRNARTLGIRLGRKIQVLHFKRQAWPTSIIFGFFMYLRFHANKYYFTFFLYQGCVARTPHSLYFGTSRDKKPYGVGPSPAHVSPAPWCRNSDPVYMRK